MIPQRVIGIAVLVIGVVLLVIGLNSSHSTVDQLSNSFTGRFTDHTMWYIVGGIGTGVAGLVLLSGFLGKKA
jgi:hypothetical protein